MQLLIYTEQNTSRLAYAFKIVFDVILGVKYNFTNNKEEFINSSLPKLNYSKEIFADEIFIESHSLLFETGNKTVSVDVSDFEGAKILFRNGTSSTLPFDIFAASFYLVSRYEEYQSQSFDNFQRFNPQESIAFKNGFLSEPVVNIWAKMLEVVIRKRFPEIEFKPEQFKYISTIDVDNAYAFLHKGFFRSFASTIKSIVQLDFTLILKRFAVLSGKQKDPYDTYDYLEKILGKYKIEPVFFFLLGAYGRYDKNISPDNTQLRKLIVKLASTFTVGIHPSYESTFNKKILKDEIEKLQLITGKPVIKSRQHFLKLSLPQTYRNLIALGISEDYTMGYASQPGFRAGICSPFPFFDLQAETETDLLIYPFQVMETTFHEYLNMSPDQACDEIYTIIQKVKKVNGTFISLWHNESVSDQLKWKGWKVVFEKMLEFVN